ncbi:heat-inducible transcription repressor HrcA [bacterium]|nr:heat-inducible transcription repressor HrcA [bacterium]
MNKRDGQFLNEREKFVLQILVKEYCRVKTPVGSTYLKKRFNLDISSATLRNVFAALEEKGYLFKAHTSGGRIPTDLAFRSYVDHLLHLNQFIQIELRNLKSELDESMVDLENVMVFSSKMISKFTNEMAFSLGVTVDTQKLKGVHFNQIAPNQILALIYLSSGLVLDKIFFISDAAIDRRVLKLVEGFINDAAKGRNLAEIEEALKERFKELKGELKKYDKVVKGLLGKLGTVITEFQRIHLEPIPGHEGQLSEFNTGDRMKELILKFSALDSTRIFIGQELGEEELKEMTIITSPFKINDERTGLFGIVGPKAMYYDFNIDFLRKFSQMVSDVISEKFKSWR